MTQISLTPTQVDTLVRLLGAGQGVVEYSLENDDVRGIVRRMAEGMVEEYRTMISLIASQHNDQMREPQHDPS